MWGYGPGAMMGGWGFGGFGMIFPLIVIIALVVGCVWLARNFAPGSASPPTPPRSRALDVLEERYARGEIDRDEYLRKRSDLAG